MDSIKHQTYIDVNKYGVEAAAASSGEIVLCDRDYPPPDVTLILNRPFSFLIRGNISKTLLFMGSVYNPMKQ